MKTILLCALWILVSLLLLEGALRGFAAYEASIVTGGGETIIRPSPAALRLEKARTDGERMALVQAIWKEALERRKSEVRKAATPEAARTAGVKIMMEEVLQPLQQARVHLKRRSMLTRMWIAWGVLTLLPLGVAAVLAARRRRGQQEAVPTRQEEPPAAQ